MNGEHEHVESTELGKKRRRSVLATNLLGVVVMGLLIGSLVVTVTNSFQNKETIDAVRNTQTANSPVILRLAEILSEVRRGTDRIIDCTDPGGECYKQGQRQTGKVVGSLNEVTVVASACAAGFADLPLEQRVMATRECVRTIILQGQPSKQQ